MTSNPSISNTTLNRADHPGRWWTLQADGRMLCQLCPRACQLKDGDRGFCFVRIRRDDAMVLDTYGRSTGFCIDPIEKKPLNQFFPGTPVLSFGTAGCNLGCKFCQNWDISKSREVARLSAEAMPESIADAALEHGCRSVAFTYNDPVIWAEYAIDTAAACRRKDIKAVAVTAGYITPKARGEFFAAMDAANIDLKAFTETFYYKTTGSHLQPVLDTIRYACNETDCWVELTNLVIPDANDDPDELRRMCDWIADAVGADVPIHFSAFHPDFRMQDRPRTPPDTLCKAYDLATQAGLRYVYIGNVHDVSRQSTYCPQCRGLLIARDWYQLGTYHLNGNRCGHCGYTLAGHFDDRPGDWGQKRQPIQIHPPEVHSMPSKPAVDLFQTELNDNQRQTIRVAASLVVQSAVRTGSSDDVADVLGELAEREVAGVYVTLKRGNTLRGCCGLQGPPIPLHRAIADAAFRTATSDPRMPPIQASELPYLTLSVSIIGPPEAIDTTATADTIAQAIQIGRHGIRIRRGDNVGLLLPSVAVDRNWNATQFLDAVCQKANLPPGVWRGGDCELKRFEGVYFGGRLLGSDGTPLEAFKREEKPLLEPSALQALKDWILQNLSALRSGATPMYYANGVVDQTVLGVVLQLTPTGQSPISWLRMSLVNGLPLQSTMFQLTQNAAATFAQQSPTDEVAVDVAVLSAAVAHGIAESVDLQGVQPRRRTVLATNGRHWSLAFDPSQSAQETLAEMLAKRKGKLRPATTSVYSLVCDSTSAPLHVWLGPEAETDFGPRPPAVAGSFYPAEDNEREQLVDELLEVLPSAEPQVVQAAMVPHAGLRYSGRIAADVWRRIQIPKNVLMIGPKHTRHGVDWAIAPHDRWELSPTASLPGSVELAQSLQSHLSGSELDSVAHRQEHSFETQLPLLYRLAPDAQIVCLAIGSADWQQIQTAADDLARWIQTLPESPLMVISSDMNHFADEQETHRRDALAMEQLQACDPRALLDVCERENISMCGRIPAALVLQTLRNLQRPITGQLVARGTSADTTGDSSRVVGYAGMLFPSTSGP
ncbi:AmmeMemoRadiSam system radical SAM enzyme [Roseimaritima ulvae]|uniref:Uncharacterized protein n=1 Tax=Roseimaritima ulvae TaxID=980254 RepID=A0A5B9R752_9BACT|nr:AmmeMemoRadiSam system radical SAM enzyme [Roseimaritima ulvae]QEG42263.1 hypothetical protein UC8_42970 [Roseimaritima ulvae]